MKSRIALVTLIAAMLSLSVLDRLPVQAYVLTGGAWPTPATTMYVDLGSSVWNVSFEDAMSQWSTRTIFKFSIVHSFWDPCNSPQAAGGPRNGVKFSLTECGDSWPGGRFAVTHTYNQNGIDTQSGILFNSNYQWNVYNGPFFTGTYAGIADFHRVAEHELGHVMGLNHEDVQTSIMATIVKNGSTIIIPQADDIAGVTAIYSGPRLQPSTDTSGPNLVVYNPVDGDTVDIDRVVLGGWTLDQSGVASVVANGIRATNDAVVGTARTDWTVGVPLALGANRITVVATDASTNHNTTVKTVTINYDPAVPTHSMRNTSHVFPRYADGVLSDGTSYRSTLMISNPLPSAANCTLTLNGMTVNGKNSFNYSLAAGGWQTDASPGTQSFQAGYAKLQCTNPVEASVLYTLYGPGGTKSSEATVFSSPPGDTVEIVVDQRGGERLGLGLANDSAQPGTFSLTLFDSAAKQVGSATLNMAAKSAQGAFLEELMTVPAKHVGYLVIRASNAGASAIGLRYTGQVFTTIPQSLRSPTSSNARSYHVFPQFAIGVLPDHTSYRATLLMTPITDGVGCHFDIRGSDFTLYPNIGFLVNGKLSYGQLYSPGELTYALMQNNPISGYVPVVADEFSWDSAIRSGYATLDCNGAVEAAMLYSFYSASGQKISEATVFSSPSGQELMVLNDQRDGSRLGLAIANDSVGGVEQLYIYAYDQNGQWLSATQFLMEGRQSKAAFVDELLNLPADHVGTIVVRGFYGPAQAPSISVIGLKFTGGKFTTIPQVWRK